MSRRRFDNLVAEISVAVGARVPRYDLWLTLHECGADPESMTSRMTLDFCEEPLTEFLAERGLHLNMRSRRRLLRAVERYDPDRLTPEEALFGSL
jgi:hypothetical protein